MDKIHCFRSSDLVWSAIGAGILAYEFYALKTDHNKTLSRYLRRVSMAHHPIGKAMFAGVCGLAAVHIIEWPRFDKNTEDMLL